MSYSPIVQVFNATIVDSNNLMNDGAVHSLLVKIQDLLEEKMLDLSNFCYAVQMTTL
jgi:hypothetical protein